MLHSHQTLRKQEINPYSVKPLRFQCMCYHSIACLILMNTKYTHEKNTATFISSGEKLEMLSVKSGIRMKMTALSASVQPGDPT